jgi:hypothetical protein
MRLRCRLGEHDSVRTGRKKEVVLFEGPLGRRVRLYDILRCVHCGAETVDHDLVTIRDEVRD